MEHLVYEINSLSPHSSCDFQGINYEEKNFLSHHPLPITFTFSESKQAIDTPSLRNNRII